MRFLRFLLFFIFLFPAWELTAQETPIWAGVHTNFFAMNRGSMGLGVSLQVYRLHFDISTNFATGDGVNLQRSNTTTHLMQKQRIGVFNAGYLFPLRKFNLIPKIGIGWTFDIWQTLDPVPSYYLYNEKNYLNFGLTVDYRINDRMGVQLNAGKFEHLSLGVNYYLGRF